MQANKVFLKKIVGFFVLALLLGAGISGCSNGERPYYLRDKVKTPVVVDPKPTLLKKLNPYIAKLPSNRQPLMLIAIPKQDLFNPSSANFTKKAPLILNDVAKLLQCYEKEDVQIINTISQINAIKTGNHNEIAKITYALTEKQALNVMQYLWARNINAQLIYTNKQDKHLLTTLVNAFKTDQKKTNLSGQDYLVISFKSL